jgi:hypothetical protein
MFILRCFTRDSMTLYNVCMEYIDYVHLDNSYINHESCYGDWNRYEDIVELIDEVSIPVEYYTTQKVISVFLDM